jgi:hypothetical protein
VEKRIASPSPEGREKIAFPHDPEHPPSPYLDAIPHPEPGPHFPVPFPLKRGGRQVRPDQFQELVIREDGLGPPFAGRRHPDRKFGSLAVSII